MPFNISSISIPLLILIILGFLMAFCIVGFTIPSIVNISKAKGLLNTSNGRTSHTDPTPTFGGIAVFIGVILSTVIFAGTYFVFELKYIISALLIVFFTGIKDDILVIDPYKKMMGQVFAIILIAVFADIRITNLYGLFHIYQLPYMASVLLTVFVFIVIINGFNLIDGIDGLAAGIGMLTSSVFGIWFWMTGNFAYTIFSFSFVGALAAFFYFNVFGKKNKIFLGDTGSLITGFVVAILACRFMQLEFLATGITYIESTPTVVCGILVVPLYDSLRVFILRVGQGKSPFKADRQHIHHRLLKLGCTHLQATLILLFVNLCFIVLSFLLRGIGIFWLMFIILISAGLLSSILVIFTTKRTRKTIIYYYYYFDIWKGRSRLKRIIEKRNIRNIVLNSSVKADTHLEETG